MCISCLAVMLKKQKTHADFAARTAGAHNQKLLFSLIIKTIWLCCRNWTHPIVFATSYGFIYEFTKKQKKTQIKNPIETGANIIMVTIRNIYYMLSIAVVSSFWSQILHVFFGATKYLSTCVYRQK